MRRAVPWSILAEPFEPNPSTHALYAEKYALYKETYIALAPLFQRANSRS